MKAEKVLVPFFCSIIPRFRFPQLLEEKNLHSTIFDIGICHKSYVILLLQIRGPPSDFRLLFLVKQSIFVTQPIYFKPSSSHLTVRSKIDSIQDENDPTKMLNISESKIFNKEGLVCGK